MEPSLQAMLDDLTKPDPNRFQAKLEEQERREILAMRKRGVAVPVLAAAYSVNRRTISSVVNSTSGRYRSTRQELANMGLVPFLEKYTTESAIKRCAEAAKSAEAAETATQYEKAQPARVDVPNPLARAKGGEHTIKAEGSDYYTKDYRIRVQLMPVAPVHDPMGVVPVWGYYVLNGDDPDEFHCQRRPTGNAEIDRWNPFRTSQEAYVDAKEGGCY